MSKNHIKLIGCWGLVFLQFWVLHGQQYLSTPVSNNNNKKYYEGRIDDLNEIKVTLVCLDNSCTGELLYVKSGDRFSLKGTQEENQLTLEEYDQFNQLSGLLKGQFVGNSIEVIWENAAQTVGSELYLTEATSITKVNSNCGNNKWIQAYEGMIQGKEMEMILQKVDNHRVVGTGYLKKDKQAISIRGTLTNNNLHLTLVDASTQRLLGSVRAIYRNQREISASYYDWNNVQSFASFKLNNSIGVNCLEYADYFSNYDFIYPKSQDMLFNQIMAFLTKDWVADSKKQSQSTRKNSPTPALRASQRGYTWTDISLYKDDFLCGLLTYDNTWSNKKATKAFNYDFANKSSIELEDIFKAGFDYQQYIRNYIKNYLKEDPAYRKDIGYQAWVDQQSFSLFTVGRDGLFFFTDYHSVYGRQSVLIPYKKIKSNIKKQATVRRLF